MHTFTLGIKKICVIGAGNMGAKIAGLIATTAEVLLLDIPDHNSNNKNQKIANAVEALKIAKPNALWDVKFVNDIKVGNLEDNLGLLKDCDLIIEAIVEDIDVKTSLFNKIASYIKKDCIIASNTSTFCLKTLKSGVIDNSLKDQMVVMHFFNPPLHMKLLEFVYDQNTKQDVIEKVNRFCYKDLGKTVIACNDTPGFIANRVGCFMLNCALYYADLHKVRYDVIDQIFTDVFKLPSTGIFGLYDLIGVDIIKFINDSLTKNLEQSDRYNKFISNKLDDFIQQNALGKKSGVGFYNYANKDRLVRDFSGNYVDTAKVENYDLDKIMSENSELTTCIKMIISELALYAFSIVGTAAHNVIDIDTAMKLGYGFNVGIFEFCTKLGGSFEWLEHFAKENNIPIPSNFTDIYKRLTVGHFITGLLTTKIASNQCEIIEDKEDAALYLMHHNNGSDQLCFAFKTKMNTLTSNVFSSLIDSIDYAEKHSLPLYIYNDFRHFSVGGDLKYFYHNAINRSYKAISDFIKLGQRTNMRIKYASIPIVACAKGFALGGGTEILLHCHHILSSPDLKAGLVEASIGLIPGWGGFKEMMLKSLDTIKLERNIVILLQALRSKTAYEFSDTYGIQHLKVVMHENTFFDAELLHTNRQLNKVFIPNLDIASFIDLDTFDDHTKFIAKILQQVCNSTEYSEIELLKMEHDIFMDLIKEHSAQSKIRQTVNI